MPINKKYLLATSFAILSITNISMAHNTQINPSNTESSLKEVMQGLLKDTQMLTAAMLNEDFTLIAVQANKIAKHPKPSMAIRMKIMKSLGADMAEFKANDVIVHQAAVDIMTHAQQKNIKGVSESFKQMIGGCLSCHTAFKSRVSAVLK